MTTQIAKAARYQLKSFISTTWLITSALPLYQLISIAEIDIFALYYDKTANWCVNLKK